MEKISQVVRESPSMIPDIIEAHWRAVPKEPVHLIGEPSTVKSEGVYQKAKQLAEGVGREFLDWNRSTFKRKEEALANPEKYFVFADVRASETDIGELRLQDMKGANDYISFKYNLLFKVVSQEESYGILFFDEMNLAPNMIKAQFYKLINDRCIGDIPIADGVMCVSAGNEAQHARGVTEDPVPLVLRRGNYFIRPLTSEEYTDYAVKTGQHSLITAYLAFSPQNVHKIRYDLQESVGQPCPRTWTKLSHIMQANPSMSDEMLGLLARGMVGQGVGSEFVSFVKMSRKVKIDDIMRDPESIKKINPDETEGLSILWAVVTGVVEKVREDKKRFETAMEVVVHVPKTEIGVFMVRQIRAVVGAPFLAKYMGDAKNADKVSKFSDRYKKFLLNE